MLPPLPPSPPEGPPRGTYFSRRKATQPLPPSPAFTKILASSTNTWESYLEKSRRNAGLKALCSIRINEMFLASCRERPSGNAPWHPASAGSFGVGRRNADEAPAAAAVFELHVTGD